MLTSFDQLPSDSRVWIYQCNRKLTDTEVSGLKDKLDIFLKNWTAHGTDLHAAAEVKYNWFVVIGLDQEVNVASGCSIDAQVHFIQQLERDMDVELLDKMNVTYIQNDRIHHKPLLDFKKMVKNGAVGKNTIVFNNLVNTKGEFEEHWEVPAIESWHNRFFK